MIRIRRIDPGEGEDGILLAPMVDVVFLLLFFFLVTGSIEQAARVLPIHLPTASVSEAPRRVPKEVRIEVDPLGRIYLDGEAVTLETLGARLKEIRPEEALIAADRSAYHGVVVGVIAKAKAAGIERFAFEVAAE